jgi:hypothetical protein
MGLTRRLANLTVELEFKLLSIEMTPDAECGDNRRPKKADNVTAD